MSEWQAKFGWIIPSWNTVTEFEVARLADPSISNHFARIEHLSDTPEAFDRMGEEAPTAAGLLSHAHVDAICYACTSGSFYRGRAYDARLASQLSTACGRPVITMADSIVQAAKHLGLRRLCVAAPYEDWLLALLVTFLEDSGFEVVRHRGLGHQANVLYPPQKALELAESAWDPSADGLVMSCGNFRTLEVLDEIEEQLAAPVVTSIQASVWNLEQAVGIPVSRAYGGRLLRGSAPSDPRVTTASSIRVE